jgi:hypothetical protein
VTDRPVADPTGTLALIAEFRLTLRPLPVYESRGQVFLATRPEHAGRDGWEAYRLDGCDTGMGLTIADAVRACVARIKAQA